MQEINLGDPTEIGRYEFAFNSSDQQPPILNPNISTKCISYFRHNVRIRIRWAASSETIKTMLNQLRQNKHY